MNSKKYRCLIRTENLFSPCRKEMISSKSFTFVLLFLCRCCRWAWWGFEEPLRVARKHYLGMKLLQWQLNFFIKASSFEELIDLSKASTRKARSSTFRKSFSNFCQLAMYSLKLRQSFQVQSFFHPKISTQQNSLPSPPPSRTLRHQSNIEKFYVFFLVPLSSSSHKHTRA